MKLLALVLTMTLIGAVDAVTDKEILDYATGYIDGCLQDYPGIANGTLSLEYNFTANATVLWGEYYLNPKYDVEHVKDACNYMSTMLQEETVVEDRYPDNITLVAVTIHAPEGAIMAMGFTTLDYASLK